MAKKPPAKPKATPKQSSDRHSVSSADLPKKLLEDALKVASVIKDEYAGKLATWEDIAKGMDFSPTNPNN